MLNIIADENIPLVREAFSELGKVHTFAGRHLTHANLGEAEVLLVRSVTKVDQQLLAGSAIRFIGTATIGLDHIDLAYLHQNNIGFASAPGSNATSAAEYVLGALLIIAERQGFLLHDKTVGIIGCGNVGSQVLQKLTALGVKCMIYDPPLQTANLNYVDLDTVLKADIITLHVPLTNTGAYPTNHLINAELLAKLRKDVILINASRGAVIEEAALLEKLATCPTMTVVLDVWENEPKINHQLLQLVALGTPHIAGYSFDGKVRGTEMLYAAVCGYFNLSPNWQVQIPAPPLKRLTFSATVDDNVAIHTAVTACYDVRRDDAALRQLDKTSNFDLLRKNYPQRREFNCIEIEIPAEKSILATQLQGLGFKVELF